MSTRALRGVSRCRPMDAAWPSCTIQDRPMRARWSSLTRKAAANEPSSAGRTRQRYWRLAWSPDGRTLAAVSGNADSSGEHMNVVALNVDDGSEKVITPHRMAFLGNLAWLSDGSGLLMVATDRLPRTDQIWYLSYPAGIARRLTNDVHFYSALSLHPNSTALVTSQSRRRRNVLDRASRQRGPHPAPLARSRLGVQTITSGCSSNLGA